MSSVRFFKIPDEFLQLVLEFDKLAKAYKHKHEEELHDQKYYTYLTHPLEEKRSLETKRTETGLDFVKDVVDKYAKLMLYKNQIEKAIPLVVFATALERTLTYLKQDVALYEEAPEVTKEENELCEQLIEQIKQLEENLKPWLEEAQKLERINNK